MNSRTKFGLIVLSGLTFLVAFSRLTNFSLPDFSRTFSFEFERKPQNNAELESIVRADLSGTKGNFAVYIEQLPASSSATPAAPKKYTLNEVEPFPAASLYKLVLLAAVFKEVENGQIKLDESMTSTKSHLVDILGETDFGYEKMPENITFTVEEALARVGRISDNFAAIMLTDRLRQVPQKEGEEGLLIQMTNEIGMKNTDFSTDPIITTALDIGTFFKALYAGRVVSQKSSAEIVRLLDLNQLDNRIPAKLPAEVKVIHKTGELALVRHDAGIVYLPNRPYLIVLLSKDLEYEDDGVETLAQISKDVYDYFRLLK